MQKVHAQLGDHTHLARPRFAPDAFIVRHYAQEVTYNGAGFLDKNRDTITGNAAQRIASFNLQTQAIARQDILTVITFAV